MNLVTRRLLAALLVLASREAWAQNARPDAGPSASPAAAGAAGAAGAQAAAGPAASALPAGSRGLGPAQRWEATEGGWVVVQPPPGATPTPAEQLPSPDLSSVAGARLVLRRGASRVLGLPDHASDSVYAVCARAPGAHVGAGGEMVVFDRLHEVARGELAKAAQVDSFQPLDPRDAGPLTLGGYSAVGRPSSGQGKLWSEGRYVLGYVGDGPDVLVCAVACTEVSSEQARVCPQLVESARVEATFVSPPQPSLPTRVAFAAAHKPLSAAGLLLGLMMMASGLVVAAWPARKAASPGGPEGPG